jgi:hypothetical protein
LESVSEKVMPSVSELESVSEKVMPSVSESESESVSASALA